MAGDSRRRELRRNSSLPLSPTLPLSPPLTQTLNSQYASAISCCEVKAKVSLMGASMGVGAEGSMSSFVSVITSAEAAAGAAMVERERERKRG